MKLKYKDKEFEVDQEELTKRVNEDLDVGIWVKLSSLNECIMGCEKFNEPLYLGKGGEVRELNPSYIFHLKQSHGFPPVMLIEMISQYLYKTEKGRERFKETYSFLEKY